MHKYTLTIVRGLYHSREVDTQLVNIRTALAVGIGAGLAAFAYSLYEAYPPVAIALGLAGVALVMLTLYDRIELEYRHLSHNRIVGVWPAPKPPKPVEPSGEVREIPLRSASGETTLVMAPEDESLIESLLDLLGRASKIKGKDEREFPPYRAMGYTAYGPYDKLLRALGRAVAPRKRGDAPKLVGYTFETLGKALGERALLPSRQGAPESEKRL